MKISHVCLFIAPSGFLPGPGAPPRVYRCGRGRRGGLPWVKMATEKGVRLAACKQVRWIHGSRHRHHHLRWWPTDRSGFLLLVLVHRRSSPSIALALICFRLSIYFEEEPENRWLSFFLVLRHLVTLHSAGWSVSIILNLSSMFLGNSIYGGDSMCVVPDHRHCLRCGPQNGIGLLWFRCVECTLIGIYCFLVFRRNFSGCIWRTYEILIVSVFSQMHLFHLLSGLRSFWAVR